MRTIELPPIPTKRFALWYDHGIWHCIFANSDNNYWLEGYESGPECEDVSVANSAEEAIRLAYENMQ